MTQEHPITPPPELVKQWASESLSTQRLCTHAARWGADQELKACCEWTAIVGGAEALRAARRPKPPSLKERGRKALQSIHNAIVMETGGRELDVLKEIVESLPD